MKILWMGNAPWSHSGYGKQAGMLLPRFRDDLGYEVAVLPNAGLIGNKIEWNGFTIYPPYTGRQGEDVALPHAETYFGHHSDGLVVSMFDTWVATGHPLAELNWLAWVPVDHDPLTPNDYNPLIAGNAEVISLSKHGRDALRGVGFKEAGYIPCVIDTKRLVPGDKREARRKLVLPNEQKLPEDAFVVGMVALNRGVPNRKSFPEIFSGFAEFKKRHTNAVLYVHTEPTGLAFQGYNLRTLVDTIGLPHESVIFCDQYNYVFGEPESYMATMYQALDVYIGAAMGEGFGVPLCEAQACGRPVIATDFTAMTELVGAGWLVSGQRYYNPAGTWHMLPNIQEIDAALEQAYEARNDTALQAKARTFAEQFDVDHVVHEYWKPLLKTQEQRVAASRVPDEFRWFEEECSLKLAHRYTTMLTALKAVRGEGFIVETGTMRAPGAWKGDGCSTYVLGTFAQKTGRKLFSVDADPKAVATSTAATKSLEEYVCVVCDDSVHFLREFDGEISLLYLDSLDCVSRARCAFDESPSEAARIAQAHQLREIEAVWDKLRPGAVIVLDDNAVGSEGGKTFLSKKFLESNGAKCLIDAYQSVWTKEAQVVTGEAVLKYRGTHA